MSPAIRSFAARMTGRCGCGQASPGPASAPAGAPQLLVDVSVIYRSDARTGIQRVVRALLLQLLTRGVEGYRVRPVFATARHGYHYAAPDFLADPAARTRSTACVHAARGDIFIGLDLALEVVHRHRRQLQRWSRTGVRHHYLAHDMLPVSHPHWFERRTVVRFRRWLQVIARTGGGIACVSRHSQSEYRTRFPGHAVTAIRLGGDIAGTAPSNGVGARDVDTLQRLFAGPGYVLMVGTVEPRKGHDRAIAAFERLWADPASHAPDLVIVGRPGWKTDDLQHLLRTHPLMGARLHWFDDASDELLERLYRGCRGVLAPSLAEGFGLPVAEAALHGKPTLARNLPVFWEQGWPGLDFFADDRPVALAASIAAWLAKSAARRGLTAPPRPDWSVTCDDLLGSLELTSATTVVTVRDVAP